MSSLVRQRYEVLHEAGHGAQGTVVKALDVVHGRPVALKMRRFASEPERAILLEEARILLSVRPHPNLPLLREDFVVGDWYYLVMDWIEGCDLRQKLRLEGTPGLGCEAVLDYLSQAAAALDHLHDHDPPVVHRDVKPANLILTPDGQVVLVDFGISRAREDVDPRPRGTPGYTAPEVAVGGHTPASDIFSLAVTAYTLLTGSPPRPEVRFTLAELPDEGRMVLLALRRGLAIDPARRPASATALVEAIRAAARPSGGGAPGPVPALRTAPEPTPFTHRGSRSTRPVQMLAIGAAMGVAVLVGLAARSASRDGAAVRATVPGAPLIHVGDGLANCPEGYLCVWKDAEYQGGGVGIFRREKDWAALPEEYAPVAQEGSSFFNHGIPAPRDRFPDVALFTGPDFAGERVCLRNGSSIAKAAGSPLEDAARSNQWLEHC